MPRAGPQMWTGQVGREARHAPHPPACKAEPLGLS